MSHRQTQGENSGITAIGRGFQKRGLSASTTATLVKTAYRRDDDDDEAIGAPSNPENNVIQGQNDEKKEGKKRLASFAAESAAKLLKLTENSDTSDLHAVDIASQMLHHNQESQTKKKTSNASSGPRGLLDLLPTPKSQQNDDKRASESLEENITTGSLSTEQDRRTSKSISLTPAPSSSIGPSRPKTKSLTPDVHLDESILAQLSEDEPKEASQSQTTKIGPSRPVGPVRPSYLSSSSVETASPSQESSYHASTTPSYSPSTNMAFSGSHQAIPHYDPTFNMTEDGTQIVDINVADLVANPVHGAPIPVRNAGSNASRMAGVSRAARGKNQITYLAAIAPDTERIMAEKKAERAKGRANSHFH